MRIAFAILVLFHGLIHLMGFAKAFQLAEIDQLKLPITKPLGLVWLTTSLLFFLSIIMYLLKKEYWFITAGLAVVLSQLLIILFWKDAKYGSIINIIILLICLSVYGSYQFKRMVEREITSLHANIKTETTNIIEKDIKQLPPIVQNWLQQSGVVGKQKVASVYLEQKGRMKSKPESKWMPFTATQYFNLQEPSFIWKANVGFLPIVTLLARDQLKAGEGKMLIALYGLLPVVNEGGNKKINSATMIRYLSEMCWFPSFATSEFITWEPLGTLSAKATFIYNQKSVSGVFKFNQRAELIAFEADRYFGGGKDATIENWLVEVISYKTFNGVKVPNKCKVTWRLKEGDFHWLDIEIIKVNYSGF